MVHESLRSKELAEDNQYTETVGSLTQIKTGDIIGVRYSHRTDPKYDHVGLVLVQNGVINFLHNARHIGHTVIQPLEEAQKFAGHEVLAWIKRVKKFDPNFANHTFLHQHGLQDLITV